MSLLFISVKTNKIMNYETNIKIFTTNKNIAKAIPTKDIQKINHVVQLYDQFKNKWYCNKFFIRDWF